jgi:hypothetical protein
VRDNTSDLRSYQNRYARFKRTAGSLTINGTSWADLPTIGTTWDLTLNATAGDVIETAICFFWNNEAVEGQLDVVTVVGGVVTNSFGGDAAPSNTHNGILSWRGGASRFEYVGGNFFRTLVAGDISANTVTLRLRCKTGTAANKTIGATVDAPFEWWARNNGPVTT